MYRQAAYFARGITHDLDFGRDQMARRIYDSKKRIGLIAVDKISSEMAKDTLSLNLRVFRETCSFVREAIYIGRCKVALRRKTLRSHGRLGTAVALNDFGAGF